MLLLRRSVSSRELTTSDPEEGSDDPEAGDEIEDIALVPSDAADPRVIVDAAIPKDIRDLYEVYSYRNAAVILSETRAPEFNDLLDTLRAFRITKTMIRTAGGNESEIPKLLSRALRPLGWHETIVQGDLLVKLRWKVQSGTTKKGKATFENRTRDILREKYLDGHKIDYVKGKVAFDLEWNSKDQTFDRDLYAFSAFSQCGVIDAAVLVTRGLSLNPLLKRLGQSLKKDGSPDFKLSGAPRMTHEKYGASTTWMGKLLYRLNAGRNGGCPVLVFGITPNCVLD
ncbi:MAG: restriction endonuclease [Reyranella sp.]|nr:restriction endonuclease [Reyranella sp.]